MKLNNPNKIAVEVENIINYLFDLHEDEQTYVCLSEHISKLQKQYGSLYKMADKLGINISYLKALKNGTKTNPSPFILNILGLTRVKTIHYYIENQSK